MTARSHSPHLVEALELLGRVVRLLEQPPHHLQVVARAGLLLRRARRLRRLSLGHHRRLAARRSPHELERQLVERLQRALQPHVDAGLPLREAQQVVQAEVPAARRRRKGDGLGGLLAGAEEADERPGGLVCGAKALRQILVLFVPVLLFERAKCPSQLQSGGNDEHAILFSRVAPCCVAEERACLNADLRDEQARPALADGFSELFVGVRLECVRSRSLRSHLTLLASEGGSSHPFRILHAV